MEKLLVAVFDNETAAYEGLSALKNLHEDGDISLYATGVLSKDEAGVIDIKEQADEGPVGTALGALTGALVGLLGGPAGVATGTVAGGLTGSLLDLKKAGVNTEFLDEVADRLIPGTTAVVADVEEIWTTPVDTRLHEQGGIVFRRHRSEVIDEQLAREVEAFDTELQQLQDDWREASRETKASIHDDIDTVREQLKETQAQVNQELTGLKSETNAKLDTLQDQLKESTGRQKEKLEKRMHDVKADLQTRTTKLERASALTKEALL